MVHPHFRGYVHRTVFYSTLYKNHSSDLRTQLQITSSPQSCALSCRSLRTQLQIFLITQKPSVHTAAKVIHAHSWDLTFRTKQALASHQFILHQKPNLNLLKNCLFIQVHLLQNHGLKPWAPRTLKPGLKPWVNYKKRALTQPRHP